MTYTAKVGAFVALLYLCGSTAGAENKDGRHEWQTLQGCHLVANDGNDGDSFHVQHEGREYVFRLYFVDAPETDDRYPERIEAQAAYFGVSIRQVIRIGEEAKRFTQRVLTKEFSIATRWQDAMGQSYLGRRYGVVTVEGRDLGELLVESGLARIHGVRVSGIGAEKVARLKALENEARLARRGAWRYLTPER